MSAITISGLSFRYNTSKDWVLKDINLRIEEGEFVAITGPTGSGKTTLCEMLNGVIPNVIPGIYRGEIKVFGKDPARNEVSEMAKLVGITFQDPEAQLFGLTVEEDVAFGPENYALPRHEIVKRVEYSLELLRLKDLKLKSPFNLSGGQKQRVALASVLALRPKLLVLDEPFTELDPIGKVEVSDAIERLRREYNLTVVLVEHDAEEIARHADRVLLLDKGQLILDLPTAEFFAQVEVLHDHGVRAPQVTELFSFLKKKGIRIEKLPITFDDGITQLSKMLCCERVIEFQDHSTIRSSQLGEEILRFKDVSFSYPDGTRALDSVSLSIRKNEYVALVGQNGSGKTTLAKIMVGLLRPSEGEYILYGEDTSKLSVAQIARKVGYLFQNPDHQIFSRTVLEEVGFGPTNLGLPADEVRRRSQNALLSVGLLDMKDSHPLFASRGERQRIALASILSMQPEVLILDEPTTGQDWTNNVRILDLADELNRLGKTIIMISHNMQFVAERSRRVIVMRQGSVLLDAPTREAFSRFKELKEAFIRPPQVVKLSAALRDKGVTGIALSVDELAEGLMPCLAR